MTNNDNYDAKHDRVMKHIAKVETTGDQVLEQAVDWCLAHKNQMPKIADIANAMPTPFRSFALLGLAQILKASLLKLQAVSQEEQEK